MLVRRDKTVEELNNSLSFFKWKSDEIWKILILVFSSFTSKLIIKIVFNKLKNKNFNCKPSLKFNCFAFEKIIFCWRIYFN